jgi:hypothetical protein
MFVDKIVQKSEESLGGIENPEMAVQLILILLRSQNQEEC